MIASREAVVTNARLWEQALSDWGGKEVQTGYTLTYVWMANQLGHFALGFCLTFVLTWIIQAWGGCVLGCSMSGFKAFPDIRPDGHLCAWVSIVAALQILCWSGKEAYDFQVARKNTTGNPFPFNGWDVLADAATAVGFITFGIAVAFSSFLSWRLAVIVLLVGLVGALFPARYWLARKYCFQRATLPFQFRLSDFAGADPDARDKVTGFLAGGPGRHLLIFGEAGTGRTTLAVGILTEHAFRVNRVRYLTWAKFVENTQRSPAEQERKPQQWPWEQSDIVALDDVVQVVDGELLETPRQIAGVLERLDTRTRRALGAGRTVWVLGPGRNEGEWVRELARAMETETATFASVALRPRHGGRRYFSGFLGH